MTRFSSSFSLYAFQILNFFLPLLPCKVKKSFVFRSLLNLWACTSNKPNEFLCGWKMGKKWLIRLLLTQCGFNLTGTPTVYYVLYTETYARLFLCCDGDDSSVKGKGSNQKIFINRKRALPFKYETFSINIKHRLLDILLIVTPAIKLNKNRSCVTGCWLPYCPWHEWQPKPAGVQKCLL